MTRAGFRSWPILWQTLALLFGVLVVAELVSIGMVAALPAPRPDFYTMTEVAAALSGDADGNPALEAHYRAAPPSRPAGMIASDALDRRLARALDTPVAALRLYFEPDQAEVFPVRRTAGRGVVPERHGQPYFYNTVEAALRLPDGRWRVVRTPRPPLLSAWQKRSLLWFGVSACLMLPFAVVFARALTRPMRRLAAAVERLDRDPDAPPVPAEGPSELRLTAHALNEARRNLDAHLRARTAMIGAIAHDLRTPLARIAFRIERAPAPLREAMRHDVEQMREMIATTIAFVRDGGGATERRPVELARLATRVADHARDCGDRVSVAQAQPATVSGDRLALERLVQNLIDNAVKYAGDAVVTVAQADARARLCVSDHGPGIPDAELERMFEPFARAEPSRSRATGGLGLGLAIARSIAAAHGGSIVARNRAGGGLAVTVELPLAA